MSYGKKQNHAKVVDDDLAGEKAFEAKIATTEYEHNSKWNLDSGRTSHMIP